jgi:hypothetical protein
MLCPVCKADNTTGPACRRCKADLSALYALEARREIALVAAHTAGERGAWESAFRHALWADHLRRDAATCRLLALACLFLDRRDDARLWCARWQHLMSASGDAR